STLESARKARLLARSGPLRREQIGLIPFLAAHEIGDELAGRGREGHAVAGEARVHERAALHATDVRQRIVREAHRSGPPMRDFRVGAMLAKEVLEVLLDTRCRLLLF